VAYASQLGERRRRTHAAAARALERLQPGSVGERAALLAHHWERAGEGLQAARWHRRAAEWAGASDAAEALRHWEQVLALLAALPETDETIAQKLVAIPQSLNLSNRLGSSEEWARALFVEGKQLAERVGDLRALAGLSYAYGVLKVNAGELEDGRHHVAEAAGLAERIGDEGWTLALRMGLCFAGSALGRLEEVLQLAERALAKPPENLRLGARIVGFSPFLSILLHKASALTWMGRLREAQPILDRALDLARDDAEIEMRRSSHGQYSEWALLAGDARLAAGHVRHAVDLAERLGSARSREYAYRALGALKLLEGRWHEAAEALEGVLALAREKRTALQQEASWLADLAEAYLGLGDVGRARATAGEAVTVGRGRRARLDECRAHLALARVLLRAEGAAASGEIEAALHAACALVEGTGARVLEPFILLERAELARLTGDEPARRRALREAQRLFTEVGAPLRAEQVARALGP
jgi:adenylate cyclase